MSTTSSSRPETRARRRVVVTPRQVAAAKVQITADKTMGRTTPEWIVKLANATPDSK